MRTATLLFFGLAQACTALAACDFEYRISPHFSTVPRSFDVTLSFDAAGRRDTHLRLNDGFAGLRDLSAALSAWSADPGAKVSDTVDAATWRVEHGERQRVTVRYRVQAALADPDGWQPQAPEQQFRPQVGSNWLQFFGHAALVDVAEAGAATGPQQSCLYFDPLPRQAVVASSFGVGQGPDAMVSVDGPPSALMNAFYAAGTGWRLHTRRLASGKLHVLVRNLWVFTDEKFADQVARVVDTQRGFWGHEPEADQLFVLTSNRADGVRSAGVRVHRTAVLHAARDFRLDSGSFNELVGHENLHEWIPRRLGGTLPGRAGLQTWFSEGFTDYYTHRLLLRSGVWTLQRYADALSGAMRSYRQSPVRHLANIEAAQRRLSDRDIGQLPYLRGEFLALRWDMALRAKGHPGLDRIMRALRLPATAPPPTEQGAVERLLAALRPVLGDMPRDDLARHVDRAEEFSAGPGWLGPCFDFITERVPPWTLGLSYRSFETSQVTGVDPDGPAAAAGLRDGMPLAGWSLPGRDGQDEVELWVRRSGGSGTYRVAYRPEGPGLIEQPRYTVRDSALADPACRAWAER